MSTRVHRVPDAFHLESGLHSRFAFVVGAGAAGVAFARALLRRRHEGWHMSLTRRNSASAKELREQKDNEGWGSRGVAVYPLDPIDGQATADLGARVAAFGKIELLILASGQAILDSQCVSEAAASFQNVSANFLTKATAYEAFEKNRHLAPNADVVVVSSRVLDFAQNAPEIADQQGYRASILALEGWVQSLEGVPGQSHRFHTLRMPLIVSPTADLYRGRGIVPADYPLVDPLEYAAAELEKIFGAPKP